MRPLSPPTSVPERPVFTHFDDERIWSVPGYRRNPPHWRVEGGTYFVTFRSADSIPEQVARQWLEDDHRWLGAHGIDPAWEKSDPAKFECALEALPSAERTERERNQIRRFFVELDRCHGHCLLRAPAAREVVAEALRHFHGQRVWLGDFVVMPNHVHVLVQPFPGVLLEEWLYSVKRYSGSRIGVKDGLTWQHESFDRVVRDGLGLLRVRQYIARNPSKLRQGWFTLEQAAWLDEFAPVKPEA
jgi:REP element-mobilizing transposase RayT